MAGKNLMIDGNKIAFAKYLVRFQNREKKVLSEEKLEELKGWLDKRRIEYTVKTVETPSEFLSFEGVEVKSWSEAEARIDGTWTEPVTLESLQAENEILQAAVLELAEIIAGGAEQW